MKRETAYNYSHRTALFLSLLLVFLINACKTTAKIEKQPPVQEPQIDTLWLAPVTPQENIASIPTDSLTTDSLTSATPLLIPLTDTLVADTIPTLSDSTQTTLPTPPRRPAPKNKKESPFEVQVIRTAVDSVIQDMSEKIIHYYGNAVVKYDDITLEANYLKFNLKTNVVTATGLPDSLGKMQGTPIFTQGETKFEAL